MLLLFGFGIFVFYWFVVANWQNPQPINGVYSQPG